MPFLNVDKVSAMLDSLDDQDMGERIVSDQVLTALMSFVLLHDEMGIEA